jgi:acetyl-CoA C-acetyltransferase
MKKNGGQLGRSVSIIGVAYTPIGSVLESPEIKDFSERELFAQASLEAMEDAGVEAKEVDAFFVGQVAPDSLANQVAVATIYADWIGMRNKPGYYHEEACSTSHVGLHLAVMAVASGVYDTVLSAGVNINQSKAPLGYPPHLREALPFSDLYFQFNAFGDDAAYLYPGNSVFGPLDAAAVSYGRNYGLSKAQLISAMNKAAVIARKNAVNNPKALMATETLEAEASRFGFKDVNEYFASKFNPPMGTLMGLKHVSATVDGASALIVCATDVAKKFTDQLIEVSGIGSSVALGNHLIGTPWEFEKIAFQKAYQMAGIKDPYTEVGYMGIHGCCAQNYFTVPEAGGYFKPGEAWKAILEGRTAPDGDKPIDTSGGRLGIGHPVAGAGGVEVAEAVYQMRGKGSPNQMKKPPEVSVVQCYGGGYHVSVSVLRKL